MKKIKVLLVGLTCLFTATQAGTTTKLYFWHAMEGFIAEKLQELVSEFNTSQKDYAVELSYKGNYTETYEAGLDATKAQENAPHILQVYEIATPSFMEKTEAYIPVTSLLKTHGFFLDKNALIPAVADFYSDKNGILLGLPFNISTGLLYYNKDAFQKAGLDPNTPPKTWEEVEAIALKLKDSGMTCALTTAWPSGYLLEHFAARHNVPFSTKDNGFSGDKATLLINAEPYIYNISKFAEWQRAGLFKYAGREVKQPEELFTSGQCAMLLQGTPRMTMLSKAAKFPVGVGSLPYWAALVKTPHNLVTGGAALWAIAGHTPEEEKGIATFFAFLTNPRHQQSWAEKTGYMPLTKEAYRLSLASGYYDKSPQVKVGIESLMLPMTPYSKGIRLAGFVEVRELLIDALEQAFQGKKSAQDALNEAVQKENALLTQGNTSY